MDIRNEVDDYILDKKDPDLTVLEYFKKFKNDLPHLVMVTGGHYGLTIYDDYATDQVIRFYTYSSQPRVLARDPSEAKSINMACLNIPVDCTYRFHVVRGPNKLSPPQRMADILEKCKRKNNQIVPFLVRFADRSPEIVCGSGKETKEMTSDYLIFKEYHEHYLLGNCLLNGKVTKETTAAALSGDIQLTRIIGMQGKSREEFNSFLAEMDQFVSKNCKFDKRTGNPALTKFDCNSDATGTGAAIDPENPLVRLEDAMPNLEKKAPKVPPRRGQSIEAAGDEDEGNYVIAEPPQKPTTKDDDDDDSDGGGVYCYIEPEEKWKKTKHKTVKSPIEEKQNPPKLPPRPSVRQHPNAPPTAPHESTIPKLRAPYKNDIPSCKVSPTAVNSPESAENTGSEHAEGRSHHLDSLSISDVGEILKKLKLDKYVDAFEEDMVDGMLLRLITEDMLKQDYKFKSIEALRLTKYVQNGHIPK